MPSRLQVSTILMVLLLCDLCRVWVARVIAETFGFLRKKSKKSVSWQATEYIKQRTANTHVLCLGNEEIGDAASSKEGP